MVDEHINSKNSPFKYNGKEFDEETGNYYYGAHYYDPKLSIFISVDPLAEKYPDTSPYAYVANNPIVLVDPDGRDIYRHDEETGNIVWFRAAEGRDVIGKFDKNENGEYVLKTNRKGEPKTLVDNIAKGILKDGINFRKENNVIKTGGKNEPTEQDVKNFLVKYSDEIAKVEISGYSLVNNKMNRVGYLVEKHEGNGWDYCDSFRLPRLFPIDKLFPEYSPQNKDDRMYVDFHYHVQPKYGPDYTNPSAEDYKAAKDNPSVNHYIFFRSVIPSKNASEKKILII